MQYKRFHSAKSISLIGKLKSKLNCKFTVFVVLFFLVAFFMLIEIKKLFNLRAEQLALEKSEALLNEAYRVIWKKEMIKQFEKNLGLKKSETNDTICPYDRHILSSLTYPEQSIDSYVWSYFSLYALSSRSNFLQPAIPQTLQKELTNLFEDLDKNVMIDNLPRKCFNLKNSIILGYEDEVLEVQPVETPYLLEEHGKRWKDLLKLNFNELKKKFRLKKELVMEIQQELLVSKSVVDLYNETSIVNFVGIYIEIEDKPSIDYYKKSISFMRKHHQNTIFLVICEPSSMLDYGNLFFSNSSDVLVLRRADQNFNFALMASCNHTIISNEVGVLHALYNGGEATVFNPDVDNDKNFYIPLLMAEELPSWYAI